VQYSDVQSTMAAILLEADESPSRDVAFAEARRHSPSTVRFSYVICT
jgi:hypothetical protein